MNNIPLRQPKIGLNAFSCPYCNAYAEQYWSDIQANNRFKGSPFYDHAFGEVLVNYHVSKCRQCKQYAIWLNNKMIIPNNSAVPLPNSDLPADVKRDYLEAASILSKSPRGAAALLRLCVQRICIELGEKGENLNHDIGALVARGLPENTRKAMDTLRVTGNNSVHPGVIDLNDNPEIAVKLFALVNFIADKMITEPKEIDVFYNSVIPQSNKDAIAKRDAITKKGKD